MRLTVISGLVLCLQAVHGAPQAPQAPKAGGSGKFSSGRPQNLGKSPVKFGPKPGGCSEFEILVARGTSESGSFGLIVGDPLVASVKRAIPGSRGYAVQYPADGTSQSAPTGRDDVITRLTQQDKLCPNQKFALVGYSQGAIVMRLAAPKIPEPIQSKILAMVMFGDPGIKGGRNTWPFPAGLQSKLYENCVPGDPVCTTGDAFGPHLNYRQAQYQTGSTNFIVAAFKGTPLPAKPLPETHTGKAASGAAGKGPKSGKSAKAPSPRAATPAPIQASV